MMCTRKIAGEYCPEKILNRYFIMAWVIAFALQMGQNIFNNCVSVFVVSMGYSNTFAGALALPYMILAFFGRLYSGYISDHSSRRRGMFVGCLAFAVGSFFFHVPVVLVPVTMLIFRGVQGFGYACASTAYSAAVVDVTPKDKIPLGIGINWTAQGIAQLLGGIVTVVLVWGTNYNPLFICSTVFCVVAVVCSVLCNYEKENRPKVKRPGSIRISDMIEPRAIPYAVITVIYYLGISVGTFYTVSLAVSRGIEGGGYFFTACAVGMVITNLALVRIADRFGRKAALMPVFLIAISCDVCLVLCSSLPLLLVAGVFYGVAIGAMPVIQSAAVEKLMPNRRGAGTSTVFLAMDISMGIGPVIWGTVIDRMGFIAAYCGAIPLVFIAAVLSAFVIKEATT